MSTGKRLFRMAVACTALALGFVASPRGAHAQDLDARQRERLYYKVKPAVVFVAWIAQLQSPINVPTGLAPDPAAMAAQSPEAGGGKKKHGKGSDEKSSDQAPAAPLPPPTIPVMEGIGATGSGWVISPDGYLVTNAHVVEGYRDENEGVLLRKIAASGLMKHGMPAEQAQAVVAAWVPNPNEIRLKKDLFVVLQNGKRYAAEIKEYSPPITPGFSGKLASAEGEKFNKETGKDVAILKIQGRALPTVRLGDSDEIQIGAPVHVAGYPGVATAENGYVSPETDLEASFTRGQVSSLKLDVNGANMLQIDAAIAGGNSGGPVFSDAGDVIGMATAGAAVQGFNFVVPSNVVKEYIGAAGVDRQQSLFDKTWEQALNAYYTGQWQQAADMFDESLRLMPSLPDAIALRSRALESRGVRAPGAPPLAVGPTADSKGLAPTAGADPTERAPSGKKPPGRGPTVKKGGPKPSTKTAPADTAKAAPTETPGSTVVNAQNGSGTSTAPSGAPWLVAGVGGFALLLLAGGVIFARRQSAAPAAVQPESAAAAPAAEREDRPVGRLVVQEGPLRGNQFPVTGRGVRIGRDPQACEVVVGDETVSREHALIAPTGSGSEVMIKHLSGTNATYVNGRAIQEATLRPGDQIKIGKSVFSFEPDYAGLKQAGNNRIAARLN